MHVQRAVSFALGVLGMLVGLLGWHLWQDHQTFHVLIDAINRQQAAQGQAHDSQ